MSDPKYAIQRITVSAEQIKNPESPEKFFRRKINQEKNSWRKIMPTQKEKQVGPTPGPWTISNSDGETDIYAKDSLIACVGNETGEQEANAWLIAASPTLLEATKKALQWLDDNEFTPQVVDELRAAISTAEGQARKGA